MIASRFLPLAAACLIWQGGHAQAVSLQASLLDPFFYAAYGELGVRPSERFAVAATIGRRFPADRNILSFSDGELRERAWIGDVAVSATTEVGSSQRARGFVEYGPYLQVKRRSEVDTRGGFLVGEVSPTETRERATLLGGRLGYTDVFDNGFTFSVHGGVGFVLDGSTRVVGEFRPAALANDYEGNFVHLQLRVKAGYTFRWGRWALAQPAG